MVTNVPIWSADIFPTVFSLSNISVPKNLKLDGQNITEVLQGKQTNHTPVFSMHNNELVSIRKGDYKLFINKPKYRKDVDLSKWKRLKSHLTLMSVIKHVRKKHLHYGAHS